MCKHYAGLPKHFTRQQLREAAELQKIVYGSGTFPSTVGFRRLPEFLYKKKFREWNDRIRMTIPQDRLLVIDICAREGWETLCPFVGKPIPDAPFPHVNRSRK
jgi:hypothetical protein